MFHLGVLGGNQVDQLEEVEFGPGETVPSKELTSSPLQNLLQVGLNISQSTRMLIINYNLSLHTKLLGIVSSPTFFIFSAFTFSSFSKNAPY